MVKIDHLTGLTKRKHLDRDLEAQAAHIEEKEKAIALKIDPLIAEAAERAEPDPGRIELELPEIEDHLMRIGTTKAEASIILEIAPIITTRVEETIITPIEIEVVSKDHSKVSVVDLPAVIDILPIVEIIKAPIKIQITTEMTEAKTLALPINLVMI